MKQEALLNKKIAIKKIESKILYDDKQDIINDNDIEMTNDHCHSDIIIDIIDTIYFPIKDTLLNYNKENDLATLRVYDSIVLVDVEGIGQDIYNQWVEIHCHLIRLSNVNM